MARISSRFAATLALSLLAGCGGATRANSPEALRVPVAARPEVGQPEGALPGTVQPEAAAASRTATLLSPPPRVFGRSVQGRPLESWSFGSGDEVVLLLATIHGDEAAGTPLLEELVGAFERGDPEVWEALGARRAVLVPVVNPDGLAADTRWNERRVDLNRNFPAENRIERARTGEAPLSEPESAALAALIEELAPARVLSIHQPVGCVDYDGPAADLAAAVGAACGLPVERLGARPGSLGSWVGVDRATPILTLELPRRPAGEDVAAHWARYGPALLRFLEGAG